MDTNRLLEQLEVVERPDGTAEVHIPAPRFWDCVECFGENHLDATFLFKDPDFVAQVRHATIPHIRETLHDWVAPEPIGFEHAGSA